MGMKSKHIVSLLVCSIILIVLYMSYTNRKRDKKRNKKSVRENFVDEIMREDNNSFSLFNWNDDEESNESYENETIENFPQTTPMNVIYTDTNGNLSNTTDLGLQNLTVNGDSSVSGVSLSNGNIYATGEIKTNSNLTLGPDRKFVFTPGGDNWVRLLDKNGSHADQGFASTRVWTQNIHGNPIVRDQQFAVDGFIQTNGSSGDQNGWISGNFGFKGKNRVVIGNLENTATIGSHNNDLTLWTPLKVRSNKVTLQSHEGTTEVIGSLNTDTKLREGGNDLVPRGTIVMWNGATAPAGWALCDGNNGTPNLTNRFIVGIGSEYGLGTTGGEKNVTLTVDQIPAHNHSYHRTPHYWNEVWGGGAIIRGTAENGAGVTDYSAKTGGGQPHENRPPFYALAYIMKL